MSDKQDSDQTEAFDGKETVVDERRSPAAPAVELDPEEKPTELWAPVARALFNSEQSAQPEQPEQPAPAEESLLPRSGEIEGDPALDPEEAGTELMSGPPPMDVSDTVKMTSEEAAAAIAEAEEEAARLLSDTVEVTGEEREVARRIAAEQRRLDPNPTMVVAKPLLPQLNRECRMCGKKIESPRPCRLRGPADSDNGFHCEQCNNIFCAAHVVRVSGLIESLFSGARFRCQLCLPKKVI